MLEEIRLDGLGVIAAAVLPLGPGLTVLTGETGAGKTMVLSALELLLGGRADTALVRSGAPRAVAEGRLRLPAGHPALVRATDAGAEVDDDGCLIIRRTVASDGRSRAVLGGASVPAGTLADVGADIVAVHGQATQQRLGQPSRQRELVDDFAGAVARERLSTYREVNGLLGQRRNELAELTDQASARALEADGLRHGLDRIAAVAPQPGEERHLDERISRLAHAETLGAAARSASTALRGAAAGDGGEADVPGAQELLAHASRAVRDAGAHDPALATQAQRLGAAAAEVADVAAELAAYARDIAADPAELAAAHERLAAITSLARRYVPAASGSAGLIAWAQRATARLADLEGDDGRRAELTSEVDALVDRRAAAAASLSNVRRAAAATLTAAAGAELAGLAMAQARLTAEVTEIEPGPYGADEVTLLFTAHPGAPARPLARAASGGELSRLMLALEVALAGADPVPTMVFDEVDAGVGGEAAIEVGRRLARLARRHQVIVVTHLAQVAAFADRHISVVKDETAPSVLDGITASDVTVLDGRARVAELSRMLGGLGGSRAAQAHARELLALGDAERAAAGRPGPAC